STDGCRTGPEQGVLLIVLHNGKRDFGIRARSSHVNGTRPPNESKAALPDIPTQIRAGSDRADLLNRILADIGHKHVAVFRIPENALRIADSIGVDFPKRVGIAVVRKRIARRDAVLRVGAVVAEGVHAKYLAERRIEILCVVERVTSAAAVGETHIEKTE